MTRISITKTEIYNRRNAFFEKYMDYMTFTESTEISAQFTEAADLTVVVPAITEQYLAIGMSYKTYIEGINRGVEIALDSIAAFGRELDARIAS